MKVTQIPEKAKATVPFAVFCHPRGRTSTIDEIRNGLSLATVDNFLPDGRKRAGVIAKLKDLGFTVFDADPSPVVCATGSVDQFKQHFKTALKHYRRDFEPDERNASQEFCSIDGASKADTSVLPGAALIVPLEPSIHCSVLLPPSRVPSLRQPGDIAMLTRASLVHRQVLKSGRHATGAGVRVAMIDSGFYRHHPYYEHNGYELHVDRASDVTESLDVDITGHGTGQVANIFSCAPDAEVIGIKKNDSTDVLAFDRAAALSPQVIVASWAWNLPQASTLPDQHLPLKLVLLNLINKGITLVFSAGNQTFDSVTKKSIPAMSFPAMMPEVIAAGGVGLDKSEDFVAFSGAASFVSPIFPDRHVPDLCGLASEMDLPTSREAKPTGALWDVGVTGTSSAAPQIGGVIALLLQKNPKLSPLKVKSILCKSAKEVRRRTTGAKATAVPGRDPATGAGMVDAYKAWESVEEV